MTGVSLDGRPITAREGTLPLLPEVLRDLAARRGDRVAYRFLKDGEEEVVRWTWGEVDRRARAVAAALERAGARAEEGERALLLYPPGLDFVAALLGCFLAGVVAVPSYPPRRRDERLRAIAADTRPTRVLTTAGAADGFRRRIRDLAELAPAVWLATDELDPDDAADWRPPRLEPSHPALLQYTSGSTGDPRGVVVEAGQLAHHERLIQRAFEQSEESVIVSWLPTYHDMGLIGGVLQPLWAGASCVMMSPGAFLRRPARWLQAISRYRATTSGGPNFAYELCVRRIPQEERGAFDLASWRVAFDGAEPVHGGTLERFAHAFAGSGFDRRAFFPCYGLAEAILLVAGGPREAPPVTQTVDREALADGRVAAPSGRTGSRKLVASGRPVQEVRIVDPESRRPVAAGAVGEIWVAGEGVAAGYWRRGEATEETFRARLTDDPSRAWLRTGDLGFLAGEQLFVTGRLRDLVILRGRNHYPNDLERTAELAHPDLAPGSTAAFAVPGDGEERLVMVVEAPPRIGDKGVRFLAVAVRRAVTQEHEAEVAEVVVVKAGTLPRTSSGKVQRRRSRELHRRGGLDTLCRSALTPRPDEPVPEAEAGGLRRELSALPAERRPEVLLAALGQMAVRSARLEFDALPADAPLSSLGLDSLAAVELSHALERGLELEVTPADLLEAESLECLAAVLADRLARETAPAGPRPLGTGSRDEESGDDRRRPLSPAQRTIWFVDRLAPGRGLYNLSGAVRIDGLDEDAFRRATGRLAARHGALRTAIGSERGEPFRRVVAEVAPEVRVADGRAWDGDRLRRELAAEAARAFDLERPPLLRFVLVRLRGGDHAVQATAHHAVTDFWSWEVLLRDLEAAYRREHGAGAGDAPGDAGPEIDFDDYLVWHEARLAEHGEAWLDAWVDRLRGAPESLDLPTDRPRPANQGFRGTTVRRALPAGLEDDLDALARRRGTTRFGVLLAAFQVLLYRWSGWEDLVVGTPTAGRAAAALRDLVGCFVNPVALRADLSDDPPFERFLDATRDRLTEALHLQELPFGRVVERLVPERDASRQPIFQALFVVHRSHGDELGGLAARAVLGLEDDSEGGAAAGPTASFAGHGAIPLPVASDAALFDLTLTLGEVPIRSEERLGAALEVDAALFDRTTAERWLRRYEILLRGLTERPAERLSRLPLWSPEERWQVLGEWGGTAAVRRDPDETWTGLHAPFAETARRLPDAVALDLEDGAQWSYGGLARRSGALAARLGARGVGPDVPVGIRLERGADLVVGILAVLEAGGAYVPIDPAYPASRVDFLLADSGVGLLIARTDGEAAGAAPARVEILDPAAPTDAGAESPSIPAGPAPPAALSHLIYTSGSTGTPKGVAIPRRGAVALVRWALAVYRPDDLEAVAAVTSVCFDLSVFELFVPFAAGGRVVLARDALALPEHPGADRVRLLNTVPSAVAELLRSDRLPAGVRTVNLAGEPLAPELAARVLAAPGVVRLFDLYGPSEDTTYSTGQAVRAGEPARIGRPLAGTTVDLCDRRLQPVPPGAVGEICLGGLGLARGYAARPPATAAVFVPDPLAGRLGRPPGARLYRTGDLARFDAEGRLDFVGRRDHQVKLRGFRIELGEVEAALRSHPAVEEAAVAVHGPGTPGASLTAYVVGGDGAEPSALDPEALRRHVGERLPQAMVPARVVVLAELPRTLTGKLDRAALPAPEDAGDDAGVGEAPRTPAEERVAALFGRLLERRAVGRQDDFFRLGGHSLLAARLVAELRETTGVDLSLQEVFREPTVVALARRIDRRSDDDRPADPTIPRRDFAAGPAPASFAQERIWFLERLAPGTTAYHMPFALELRGRLDAGALHRALAGATGRHESLRTGFRETDGGLVQEIREADPWASPPMIAVDLRVRSAAGTDAETDLGAAAEAIARDFVRRPFDLSRAPLWRAALLRLGEEYHRLLLVLHHAVADGRSLDVLAREIAAGYRAALGADPGDDRPRTAATPADLAEWERRRWRAGEMEDALRRAVERLGDRPEPLALPTDRLRGTGTVRRGATLPVRLDGALVQGLDALGPARDRPQGATRFMVLLALYEVLLARWSGQPRVSVGFPFARRDRPETRDAIGLLVNTLVISGDLSGDPGFLRHLDAVRERALAAYADRDLPFERLVEALAPGRHLGRNPLFQAAFALQPATPRPELPGLAIEVRTLDAGGAKFDLSLVLYPADDPGGGLIGELEYDRDLFDRATVHRLRRSFETLGRSVVDDPERPVDRLALLSRAEAHQAVVEWNDTESPTRLPWVLEAVAARAAERPDAVALDDPAATWTYGRTMCRVLALAAGLERLGVGPETVVAIAHPRSAEQIVAALAVMAAGGAYLPIDPAYPATRQEILLTDSGARLLLAPKGAPVRELPGPWRTLALAEVAAAAGGEATDAPRRPVSGDQPAYVIYTSGSTGRPKGVVIPHRGLRSLLSWHAGHFVLGPDDRATALSGVGFDASVYEVWPALAAGSRLCLPAQELVADPSALGRWLEAERVTLTFLATPVAEAVLGETDLAGSALRRILVGGDRLRRRPPAGVAWEMVNSYGPTENSVVATVDRVAPRGDGVPNAAERRPPSIGRPLDNQRSGVAGPAGDPQPVGAVGELVLSGVGLARGYLGQPAETALRFVPDPEARTPGARRYRTGDRVRRMTDGRLDFLGRVDDQIQVRGQRVEPREVEATLAAHPGVRAAVVVAREDGDGDPRMIAYAVPATTDGETLRAWLADRLPAAMLPAAVVVLDTLPLTAHGKVDRRALPEPPEIGRAAGGPLGEMEELLAGLWREILGVAPGPDDDFFDLGGHSLLATRLASLVRQRLDLELPVRAVFEAGTLRALAARVEEARREAVRGERPPLVPRPGSGETPVSFAQQRLWFLDQLEPESPLYNIPLALRLQGPLSLAAFGAAVSGVVRRHEALRTELSASDGTVTQRVLPPRPVALPVVDLSALPATRSADASHRLLRAEAARALDLARGELVRLLALRLVPEEHRVLLTLHHVAADGWSMGILLRELTALYQAHRAGAPPDPAPLPELPVQYGDFALWQRRWLTGETLEAEIAHWRRHLADPPVLDLPADRPRPALQGFDGAQRRVRVPAELARALTELARSSGATLYMVLLAGFATLLSRLSGQTDLVVGTPIANRTQRETEGLIGFFVNMLALRIDLDGEPSFAELVARVRGIALEAYAHQELPFERVVEELEVPRDLSRNPLFQVVFTLQNAPMEAPELPGIEIEVEPVDAGTARFDLTLTLVPRPDGVLAGQVEYNRDLYDATTVERWMGQLANLLTAAAAGSGRSVDRLHRLGRGERHQVLHEWNDTARPAPEGETLAAVLARGRARTPDAPALVDGDLAWTYRELGERVERLAGAFRRAGAGPGALVGLLCERSAAMVAGLLAILETGAAYLPLDPEYPAERLRYVLADAAPAVVAVGRRQRDRVADRPLLVLEDALAEAGTGEPPPGRVPGPDDRAYVVYTSGSTGRPKGVEVTHANACNFLRAMDDLLGPPPGTLLAVTSISFDISVLELFWTLSRGTRVVLQGERGERGRELFGAAGEGGAAASVRPIDFSLFYFADASSGGAAPGGERYRLLLEGARLADAHGFAAVWTPERHFHSFGGLYPNPSVTGAAVAAVTERIAVRAGSVVLPLHNPLRVAEEWSVVDNLSGGRAGLSLASGWHANDFILAPGTSDEDGAASRRAAFENRKQAMIDGISTLRRLWRGEAVTAVNALGDEVELTVHPPTVQGELPLWLTAAGNPETFELAGSLGVGLLTHLLSQSHEELAEKIGVYRQAWRAAGHRRDGQVTLMVHAFVDRDPARALEIVRGPFTEYLRSSLHLLRPIASSMGVDLDAADFDPETEALVLDRAFERFAETSALFGSPETCLRKVERLKDLGVDEIGCLVDFGCPVDEVLASFGELDRLHRWSNPERFPDDHPDRSVVAQIRRHGVDTLQCTPSMARLLAAEPAGLEALRGLDRLLLGGEAVPGDLVEEILGKVGGSGPRIVDLYGPTETTVWSTADPDLLPGRPVTVGRPLANTTVHVVGAKERIRGIGVPGELLIGGTGVSRGYSGRPAMTADRFSPDPFASQPGGRLYRTGDRVRLDPRGRLHFLGRLDHQVKVSGHRIEPGEVETLLRRLPAVTDAVVVLHREAGAASLTAYVTVEPWARDEVWEGDDAGDGAGDTFRLPDGRRIAHLGAFQTRVGVRELFEEDWYWKHGIELPAEPTVFDVGANVGLFSLQVADRRPDARVIAFEPLPPTFDALRRNVERWVPNGRAVEAGLSDRPGEATFTFYPQMSGLSGRYADLGADRSAARAIIESGLRSVGAGSAAVGVAGEEVERFLDVELESEIHTCRLTTLSDIVDELGVERVDLLKIDVERAELDVLRGLREEHWPRVRQVVAEVDTRENLDAIVALLGERGFEVRVEDFFDVPADDGSRVLVKMVYARRPGLSPAPPPPDPSELRRPVTRETLRDHLAAHLPPSTVPSHFVLLDELPRTPNGKIDRKALPSPRETGSGGRRHVPPQLDSERDLAEIWREVLGVERVGLDENFFELGGTSLLLIRLRSRIADRLDHDVALVDLFRYPTVGSLDAFLRRKTGDPKGQALERVDDRAEKKRRALEERRRRPRRDR